MGSIFVHKTRHRSGTQFFFNEKRADRSQVLREKMPPREAPSRLVLDVVRKTRVGIVRPNGDLRNNPPLSYSSIRRSHPLACVLARETITLLNAGT